MGYSEYDNIEVILTEKYKNLCEHLLRMVEDEQIKEKMKRNII